MQQSDIRLSSKLLLPNASELNK